MFDITRDTSLNVIIINNSVERVFFRMVRISFKVLFLNLLLPGILVCHTSGWSAPFYSVNDGSNQDINEHGACSNVDNSSGQNLFVPTNSAPEWLAFRNNPPAGVSLSACPPAITGVLEPPDSVYGEASYIEFLVSWDQAVTRSGDSRIALNIGGSTKYAVYAAGSGTQNLTFRYTVQAGDTDSDGIQVSNTTIDLNGGTLLGPSALPAALDMSGFIASLTNVKVDTSITPPNQVLGVALAPTANSSTMGVSWVIPNDNGTAITYYIVQYRPQGDSLWTNHSPNPTTNIAQVSGLTSGITYEIRVAAFNGALGAYSAISTAEIFNVLDYSPITWLDGSDPEGDGTPPANGTLLATWVNKAGTGTNATEANSTKQPTFTTNVQNGLGAVRFANLDRGLAGTFTRSNGTALTIIAVVQFDSGYTDRCLFEFSSGGARGFFIDRRYAANTYFSPAITKGQINLYTVVDLGGSATVTENTTSIYNSTVDFNTDFTGSGNYVLGDDSTVGNRLYGYIC